MSYIVVKNAGSNWRHYWDKDPKEILIHISHSAHFTHTGKMENVEPDYTGYQEALEAAKRCNLSNPAGCYDVCRCKYEVSA